MRLLVNICLAAACCLSLAAAYADDSDNPGAGRYLVSRRRARGVEPAARRMRPGIRGEVSRRSPEIESSVRI